MIRWREMLMDYGQMYGEEGAGKNGTTRSGSSYFTVDGDLAAKQQADLELRRTLEVHFRPLFQRFVYGGEKIACHDLKRVLQDNQYRSLLPQEKVHELADVADFNIGRSVKYDEFVRIVTGNSAEDAVSEFGGASVGGNQPSSKSSSFIRTACRNTAHQNLVDEIAMKNNCWRTFPVFMLLMIIAQIAMFIVHDLNNDSGSTTALEGLQGNNSLMYMPTRRREAWRFFSYILLHQGYVDLIFNIALQLLICVPLEITFSSWRVATVYVVGVMVGSLSQSVADHDVGLAGAAGGVYAVIAAHLLALLQNRKMLNLNIAEGRLVHTVCSVSLRMIFIFLLVIPQVGLAVYRRWFKDDIPVKIGICAHAGGFVAGLALSEAFLKDPLRPPWKGSCLLDVFLLMILVGAAVIFNIVYDGYHEEDRSSLGGFVSSI